MQPKYKLTIVNLYDSTPTQKIKTNFKKEVSGIFWNVLLENHFLTIVEF